MSQDLNKTMNATQPSNCHWNHIAEICFLPDCSCFAGWEHRHRNNCLQDENHEKTLFNTVGVNSDTLHNYLYKAQVTEESRRAIGQRWTTTPTKRTKCAKDGHCYCVRVCSVLAPLLYRRVSLDLCIGHMVLWLPIL